MPKFMCVKDANSSQLREIWKTTAILSTELLKNHTTENHRCLWDNPAQLSTYIMDPELIWALCASIIPIPVHSRASRALHKLAGLAALHYLIFSI